MRACFPAAVLLWAWCAVNAYAIDIKPLEAGEYASLIQQAPKPALVMIWSVDCAPCHRELPQLAKLVRAGRVASLILISADSPEQTPELADVLTRAGLTQATARVFGHTEPARLRHDIDPRWSGETPRHYLYANGKPVRAWSGPLGLGLTP